MIWSIFKNCSKNKSSKSDKVDKTKRANNPNKVIREFLSKLDEIHGSDQFDDNVFITDRHFDCLSVLDPNISNNEFEESECNIVENGVVKAADGLEENIEAIAISNRCTIVTEQHLKSLQCPFTWILEPADLWRKNIVNRMENKYGKYNMNISSTRFSFER